MKSENKGNLKSILTFHVIEGKFMAADVISLINKNNGKAIISTVNLIATLNNGAVYVADVNGNSAKVITTDLDNTNGVIHVIDTVLLPFLID